MCGICGIVDFAGPPIETSFLEKMARTLHHRGPDDQGTAALGQAGLAQTRLSIIDLTPTGHQPMSSPDGRVTMIYNGELYNFPELRRRLEGEGVAFRGHSDSEVVLHGYCRWGVESFERFNGMFAIALWDARDHRLVLARDRFGIKPLYCYRLPQGLIFGSEIKAILATCRLRRELDWAALHEYLYYGNALGRHSLFAGVSKLPPGHYLTCDRSGCTEKAYWSLEKVRPVDDDLDQATAGVRQRLDQAVKDHLISDVAVGVFLSGGVDSSAITALASRHYQGRLSTFSVGFDFDRGVNELPKARRVAEQFGADHHELHIAGADMVAVIERLVRAHDEPFADAADIPLYLLCDRLRGQVKVILQGDGGDEIFAGYRRYNVLSFERFWRAAAKAAPFVGAVAPRTPAYHRAMRFFQAIGQSDPALRMAYLMTQEPSDDPPTRLFTPDARRRLEESDPFEMYRTLYRRFEHLDPVQRMLYVDCMVLLPDQFLEKVDKATMACSIEIRVPFLDANLTNYVLGLPSSYKVRRGQKKFLLRRALRGIVPDDILDGPKTGFGVPYEHWLRTSLADYLRSVVLDDSTLAWGLFDRAAVEACIDEHIAGRRNNGFLLYKLLNLALWKRFYLN